MLKKVLKEFPVGGAPAAKEELAQMHARTYFKAIVVKEINRLERKRAQEGLIIISQKRSGKSKSRVAHNGKATRDWITKEYKASPTVLNESIMLTTVIDAHKGRDVASFDVRNAFIQPLLPVKSDGERVIMEVRGKLVKWLVDIDQSAYKSLIVIERQVEALYLNILQAIYGMLEASLLCYGKLRSDLELIGFKFNTSDTCVANRTINSKQHTLKFHVNGILSSHVDPKVNDEFSR